MSNKMPRQPLTGWIYQDERVVGGVAMPRDEAAFIRSFNREYAALGMRIERPDDATFGAPEDR